jgi:hypothetical protein
VLALLTELTSPYNSFSLLLLGHITGVPDLSQASLAAPAAALALAPSRRPLARCPPTGPPACSPALRTRLPNLCSPPPAFRPQHALHYAAANITACLRCEFPGFVFLEEPCLVALLRQRLLQQQAPRIMLVDLVLQWVQAGWAALSCRAGAALGICCCCAGATLALCWGTPHPAPLPRPAGSSSGRAAWCRCWRAPCGWSCCRDSSCASWTSTRWCAPPLLPGRPAAAAAPQQQQLPALPLPLPATSSPPACRPCAPPSPPAPPPCQQPALASSLSAHPLPPTYPQICRDPRASKLVAETYLRKTLDAAGIQ